MPNCQLPFYYGCSSLYKRLTISFIQRLRTTLTALVLLLGIIPAAHAAISTETYSLPTGSFAPANGLSYTIGVGDLNGDNQTDYVARVWKDNAALNADPGFQTRSYAFLSGNKNHIWEFNHQMTAADASDPTWIAPLVIWDMDGDGRDEVMTTMKNGGVNLVMLDGMTGRIKKSVSLGAVKRVFHATLAYLDCSNPYVVLTTGDNIKTVAYDKNLALSSRWQQYNSNGKESLTNIYTANIDGDCNDEIVMGPVLLNDDGRVYLDGTTINQFVNGSTFQNDASRALQADRSFVADIDPDNPGLEWYLIRAGSKSDQYYVEPHVWEGPYLIDIDQKKIIWHHNITVPPYGSGGQDDPNHGWGRMHRGWVSDMYPTIRGLEMKATGYYWQGNEWQNALNGQYGDISGSWAGSYQEQVFLYDAKGNIIRQDPEGAHVGYPVYWDDDAGPEYFRYRQGQLLDKIYGSSIGSTGVQTYGSGESIEVDVKGDWREEVITASGGTLYVFSNSGSSRNPNRRKATQDHLYLMNMAAVGTGLPKPISHNSNTWTDGAGGPGPGPVCPDGTCNGNETNATCPQDCPASPNDPPLPPVFIYRGKE